MSDSVRRLLASCPNRLTTTDQKLVAVILADPRAAAFLSTNEAAERACVHPTSAVRFARKLGFDGYPAFRATLQNELFDESAAAERVRRRIDRLGKGEVLRPFVASEIRALEQLPNQIGDAAIKAAARIIVKAGTIFLFGAGHSETLGRLFEIRLRRGGYDALVLDVGAREAAALAMQAARNDVFILFAFFRISVRIHRLVELAQSVGAKTVLITDVMASASLPTVNVVLAAQRGDTGEARSLAVPMAIVNTVLLQVSAMDRGRMIRNLERMEAVREALERE